MDLDDDELKATRALNGLDKDKCFRCGQGVPHYCEKCYQDLVADNIKLQLEIKSIREKNMSSKRITFNEKIKRFTNNHLPKTRYIQKEYKGKIYEISYHKCCFWWQDKFSIKEYIKNLYTNHWEVNEIIEGSKIFVLGNGSGIIYGFFPKNKMIKQLYASAKYWSQY